MKRQVRVGVCIALVMVFAASCSVREVQLWFLVTKRPIPTYAGAKDIADAINAKAPAGGCDDRYSGSCVPDNASQVHCRATAGPGPAVAGPLKLKGFDAFELDPDGDLTACADPVGDLEYIGQKLDTITITGWTFDPETTSPIFADVWDIGPGTRLTAGDDRPDVATKFPGAGNRHGFTFSYRPPAGAFRSPCAYGINVGSGGDVLLGCKAIRMMDPMPYTVSGTPGSLLLEDIDVTTTGISGTGFATTGATVRAWVKTAAGTTPATVTRVSRPDVEAKYSLTTGSYGFSITAAAVADITTAEVCVAIDQTSPDPAVTQCRPWVVR